jgi:hypothetical protein
MQVAWGELCESCHLSAVPRHAAKNRGCGQVRNAFSNCFYYVEVVSATYIVVDGYGVIVSTYKSATALLARFFAWSLANLCRPRAIEGLGSGPV